MKIDKFLMGVGVLGVWLIGIQQGFAQTGAAAPPPQGGGMPAPLKQATKKLEQQFEQEPSAEDVQHSALRCFKVDHAQVASFRRGASWKALAPDVEVTFNNEQGTNDRRLFDAIYGNIFPNGKESENVTRKSLVLGVRAHWSFDRLIFNGESLDVASLAGVQEGLLREITSLFFTRRRLLIMLALNPPQNPGEQLTETIRLEETTSTIDAMTCGWYKRELKKRVGVGGGNAAGEDQADEDMDDEE